jgi:hypothetical protein
MPSSEQDLHLCSTDLGLFAAMIERGDFSCELDNVLTVNFLDYELHLKILWRFQSGSFIVGSAEELLEFTKKWIR